MRSNLTIFVIVLIANIFPSTLAAQDIIHKYDGEELEVFIKRTGVEKVVYRLDEDKKSRKYRIRYKEIRKIERENGDFHYYLLGREISMEPNDLFMSGWDDANFHYKVPTLANAVTLVSNGVFSFASFSSSTLFVTGLSLPDVLIGATPPKYENLNFPDAALMENHEYAAGYIEKASMIKETRINKTSFIGWGIGAVIFIATLIR
jgi:hypothetical protein